VKNASPLPVAVEAGAVEAGAVVAAVCLRTPIFFSEYFSMQTAVIEGLDLFIKGPITYVFVHVRRTIAGGSFSSVLHSYSMLGNSLGSMEKLKR